MTTIHISPELADKLNRLAEREKKTVNEVLERLLETQNVEQSTSETDDDLPGGAALLKAIRTAKINSGTTDTAERSREIMNIAYPKGSGAALLKSALEADIHAGDLASNSREILENEFPRYLRGRIEDQDSRG